MPVFSIFIKGIVRKRGQVCERTASLHLVECHTRFPGDRGQTEESNCDLGSSNVDSGMTVWHGAGRDGFSDLQELNQAMTAARSGPRQFGSTCERRVPASLKTVNLSHWLSIRKGSFSAKHSPPGGAWLALFFCTS